MSGEFIIKDKGSYTINEEDAQIIIKSTEDAHIIIKPTELIGNTTFTSLTDTPTNYTGNANKLLAVNSTEDGVEFTSSPIVVDWGEIYGKLSDQTDLQNELDTKINHNGTTDLTGDWTISTNNITLTSGTLTANELVGNVTGNVTGDLTGDVTGTLNGIDNTKISKLYQPDETNAFVYTDNSGILHIDGNITASGYNEDVIDHNSLYNYLIEEHRVINDTSTTATDLWSANKINTELGTKQDSLVSGTNIKTINSESLLGSGDISLQTPLVSGTDYEVPLTFSTGLNRSINTITVNESQINTSGLNNDEGFITGINSSDVTTALGYTPENLANKGQNNGYASLDSGGKVPISELPSSIMEFKGTWDASTNSPTLADGMGNNGDIYLCSVAGTQNLGSGNITLSEGDWVVYNGSIWQKSINSNAVVSVNGQQGVVSLGYTELTGTPSDVITAGDNLSWTGSILNAVNTTYSTSDFNHDDLSGLNVGDYQHLSSIQKTDLTDSGNSSLHYHSSDRDRSNHTGTQTASTISDFDTEVSNNADVYANTSARHDAVTVTDSTELDFTLTGQNITASLKTGSIDETKLDTSVNESLDLADSALQSGDNVSELTNDSGYISGITGEKIEDLSNVTITTPADNELLSYDSTSGEWINQTPTEAGFATVATSGAYSDLSGTPTASSYNHDDLSNISGTVGEYNHPTDAQMVVIGNTSGTNTGDQDSIVGISGTKAQFDTALTDGNFAYSGGAFHDGFSDYVANEHINHTSVNLTAGIGLTGGGDISSNRTFNVDVGITDDKIVQIDDIDIATSDYAKFTANGLEGRSYSEVKTDLSLNKVENTAISTWVGSENITTLGTIGIGTWQGTAIGDSYISSAATWNAKQDALNFGISDNNVVKIDDAGVASGDYAKFTTAGLQGRSTSEVKSDLAISASDVSDFDTEVSNNTDVSANTSARHNAVTVTDSTELDFTLIGQDITASLKTGSIDKTKLNTSVNDSLDLADSALQSGDNVSELTNDSGYISGITGENIEELSNVTITTPADNELLSYDITSGEWINQTPTEAGFATVATSGAYSDLSGTPTASSYNHDDLSNISGTVGEYNHPTDAQMVVLGNTSGTNTGDQDSIVGISGTKAQFDTALTDGNFAYSGGAFHDGFSDYVANEHIDWTNATSNFNTTGSISVNGTEIVGTDSEVNASVIEDKFLRNDGNDTTSGKITAANFEVTGDNNTDDSEYVPMVLHGTDATPPTASGFPQGTIYIQYTA